MFEEKNISLFHIYKHLSEPIDLLFIILATIGSLGSGISMPIMSYITTDVYADIGVTSEVTSDRDSLMATVKDVFTTQEKRYLILGIIAFVCNFLSICFWSLMGSRMCHKLKRLYFKVILSQEQGWFDENNPFEFATKVQAQLEQVEMGIGEKFGQVLQMSSQCILAFILAFILSWQVTLVMLCISPLIIVDILLMANILSTGIIMGRKTWEKAGGLAEEVLYNIKTVASFANFEFEIGRYNEKVELCYQLELGIILRQAICVGILITLLNSSFVIAILYGRTIVGKRINLNKGRDFTGQDIMSCAFCTLMGIMDIGLTAPNIKVIQESGSATSDYFTLYEREPKMDYLQSHEKPKRENIKGKIEFKDVKFIYPSDSNKRLILDGLNLVFEPGKKIALVGESGCGKSTTVNLIERL